MGLLKSVTNFVKNTADPLGVVTGDKPKSVGDLVTKMTDPADLRDSGTYKNIEDKVYKATGRNIANLVNDPLDIKGFSSGRRPFTIKSVADPMRVGIDAPSKTLNVTGAVAATIATYGAASSYLGGGAAAGAGGASSTGGAGGSGWLSSLTGAAKVAGALVAGKRAGIDAQSEGYAPGQASGGRSVPNEKRLPPSPFAQVVGGAISDNPGAAVVVVLLLVGAGVYFLARR